MQKPYSYLERQSICPCHIQQLTSSGRYCANTLSMLLWLVSVASFELLGPLTGTRTYPVCCSLLLFGSKLPPLLCIVPFDCFLLQLAPVTCFCNLTASHAFTLQSQCRHCPSTLTDLTWCCRSTQEQCGSASRLNMLPNFQHWANADRQLMLLLPWVHK